MARSTLGKILSIWTAIALALIYGLVAFFVFRYNTLKELFGVMNLAYIFMVPFAIGAITIFLTDRKVKHSTLFRVFVPWIPIGFLVLLVAAFAWEGLICVVMILPSFLGMATVGGLLYGYVIDQKSSTSTKNLIFIGLLVLPFAASPLEQRLSTQDSFRQVQNSIVIEAEAEKVWQNIIRVPKIEESEHSFSFSHAIGFPRPVEASLTHEGIGGVRFASFEGNVLFVEMITDWQNLKSLTFNIAADPDSIPQKTLDEHVTVGGPYFDVLQGHYEIEVLGPKQVRLNLSSTHRLSTHYNFYASWWTDFIMSDIQSYILKIIKRRAEKV